MKTDKMYSPLILFIFSILLRLQLNNSFAQTVVFSQNFNSPGTLSGCGGGTNANSKLGTFNQGATGIYAGNENKGDYATVCSGGCTGRYAITNQSDDCAAANADTWKDQTNTGSDGGGYTDFAMIVDGCASCAAAVDARVWCVSIGPVSTNDIYNFSAKYSSPWLSSKGNDPGIYLSMYSGGVNTKLGSTGIVDQSLSSSPSTPQPYNTQSCYYQIPASLNGTTIQFCINMIQADGGNDATIGSGTYGVNPNGQGNDFMVDDITITKYTSGTASGCTYTGPTLPVELVSFSVEKEGNNAALQWVSASEKNSSYFSIEKSDDATNFSEIGTVSAQGNSSNQISYSFEDNHYYSTSYYRLKMVDKDGSYKYSSIIVLGKAEYAKVINQMNGDPLQIIASVSEDTQWNIAVYSLLGQQYLNERISLKKGENKIVKEISGSKETAKILRITGEDGTVILSQVIW